MSEKKTFSVRLNPDLMKELRILAIHKEKSLSDLLEEAIRDLLMKYSGK
jgi:predicted transcriptional regulator